MNPLWQKIKQTAIHSADKIALQGDNISLNYGQLFATIEAFSSSHLVDSGSQHTYAVLLDNHPAWAVIDLALLFNKQCSVPLPRFFSVEQLIHSLQDSQADFLLMDDAEVNAELLKKLSNQVLARKNIKVAGKKLTLLHLNSSLKEKNNLADIVKITYTSGTTDKPKGVLLSESAIMQKVMTLAVAGEVTDKDVCLSILPLSTLLENIGGLYVPLYCSATATLLSSESIGLSGSSQLNQQQLLSVIVNYQPSAFVIIPQLLLLLVSACAKGYQLPSRIRFIAMGGAPISIQVLKQAEKLNIPVYEGYGLSEAVSVVTVNSPSLHRLGSVGKVLPNHQLKLAADNEILVTGELFSGYLGLPAQQQQYYATGDIGHLDDDGFLYITGRKKNIINTSFGRNVSPEWLEKELEAIPEIAQCVVYGHARPCLIAIIVLRTELEHQLRSIQQLDEALEKLNQQLPDYARIVDYILVDNAFSLKNKQLTGTGRPRRETIYQLYQQSLEQTYELLAAKKII